VPDNWKNVGPTVTASVLASLISAVIVFVVLAIWSSVDNEDIDQRVRSLELTCVTQEEYAVLVGQLHQIELKLAVLAATENRVSGG